MEYALDRFVREAHAVVASANLVDEHLIELVTPKPNIPADLAFPTFRAAKEAGIAPPQLAQRIVEKAQVPAGSLIGSVEATGPFVNFSLNMPRLAAAVLDEVERLGARYGSDDQSNGRTIVIDYSSPNVAKTMHVGHIRSTIIGQSLYHIFDFLGYRVIGDNHLGDWGKQFGMNIAAIVRWGKPEGDDEDAIAALDKLYARYSALVKEDEALREEAARWAKRLEQNDPEALAKREWIAELQARAAQPNHDDEARAWSLKLEQGDPLARELWQWMVDLTLKANQRNYDRLGVRFDYVLGESFYAPMLDALIEEAIEKRVAYRDEDGAVVVDELAPGLPTFLLQRSDSGTLYHTRDLACIVYREREFHPAKIIYVVDARQELHFRQLFALARAMGYAQDIELIHVRFGTIFDQQGRPLSTRAGNMVYLADLLDEAHARARAVVEQASPDLSEAEKEAIAEAVGVGAVIYNDLYQDPRRDIRLDWERMLAIEGNSAPYIQYMHARCCSILRKAAEEGVAAGDGDATILTHPSETAVIKQLAKLPGAVREAGERYAPFVIAEWCYETARALSAFYRDCSVLRAETPTLRAARLRLVAATAQGLRNGLALLGIKAPERM
jgi:arginyl-tRNA synthetase